MTIVYGLLGLSFLVFFHELGHFIAARLCGVIVESFSIGMGPILFHKKIHGVDYRVSLLPIGGYCGMKGEKDFATAVENNLPKIVAPKDSMYGAHPFKRIIIAFAGPFFNLFFAFMAFTAIAMIGYTYYAPSAQIRLADEVYPGLHSAARDAGLQSGDTILKINTVPVKDFSDIAGQVGIHPDEDITIVVDRNGKQHTFTVHTDMDKAEGLGKIGVTSIPNTTEARHTNTYTFFPALLQGAKECGNMVALTLKSITILFKGIDVTNAVSGPARITSMLGGTVQEGFSESISVGIVSTLQLLALISISLFIMNLLPIPVLDGGLILFAWIELLIRRQIPPKIQYYVQFIGFAFIAFMLVIGVTGDVRYFAKLLEKK